MWRLMTAILATALGLAACGQKGPLYLPPPMTPAPAVMPSPSVAPAAPEAPAKDAAPRPNPEQK